MRLWRQLFGPPPLPEARLLPKGDAVNDDDLSAGTLEDALELAYWQFNGRRVGDGRRALPDGTRRPQSERDAFKCQVRELLNARDLLPCCPVREYDRKHGIESDAHVGVYDDVVWVNFIEGEACARTHLVTPREARVLAARLLRAAEEARLLPKETP